MAKNIKPRKTFTSSRLLRNTFAKNPRWPANLRRILKRIIVFLLIRFLSDHSFFLHDMRSFCSVMIIKCKNANMSQQSYRYFPLLLHCHKAVQDLHWNLFGTLSTYRNHDKIIDLYMLPVSKNYTLLSKRSETAFCPNKYMQY